MEEEGISNRRIHTIFIPPLTATPGANDLDTERGSNWGLFGRLPVLAERLAGRGMGMASRE